MSDGHEKRLMVGGACHGADAVVTSRQTASDRGSELPLSISGIVDTLEESELGGIWGLGGSERVAEVLNDDVSVANNEALAVELLRRRVVSAVGVGEGSQLHVRHLHRNIKVCVGCRLLAGDGAGDDGRHHLAARGHLTHHNTITGSTLLLETVGQRLAGAKVDEIVVVCDRLGLAR